jgi:hypothetical protein
MYMEIHGIISWEVYTMKTNTLFSEIILSPTEKKMLKKLKKNEFVLLDSETTSSLMEYQLILWSIN